MARGPSPKWAYHGHVRAPSFGIPGPPTNLVGMFLKALVSLPRFKTLPRLYQLCDLGQVAQSFQASFLFLPKMEIISACFKYLEQRVLASCPMYNMEVCTYICVCWLLLLLFCFLHASLLLLSACPLRERQGLRGGWETDIWVWILALSHL